MKVILSTAKLPTDDLVCKLKMTINYFLEKHLPYDDLISVGSRSSYSNKNGIVCRISVCHLSVFSFSALSFKFKFPMRIPRHKYYQNKNSDKVRVFS